MWDLIVSVPDHCLSFYFIDGDFTQFEKNAFKFRKKTTGVVPIIVKYHVS